MHSVQSSGLRLYEKDSSLHAGNKKRLQFTLPRGGSGWRRCVCECVTASEKTRRIETSVIDLMFWSQLGRKSKVRVKRVGEQSGKLQLIDQDKHGKNHSVGVSVFLFPYARMCHCHCLPKGTQSAVEGRKKGRCHRVRANKRKI